MKTIEWVEVSQEDLIRWHQAQLAAMPPELRNPCPHCSAGIGFWCMTLNGNYAKWSHKKRIEAMER